MMIGSKKSLIEGPCPECGSKEWKIGKLIDSGGSVRYPWFCGLCGARSQLYVKKKEVLDSLVPLIADLRQHSCEVCGNFGAQLHHWAPRSIFEDAEVWPKGYLCQPCHSRWHSVMDKARKP
jgi:hypothetical protein